MYLKIAMHANSDVCLTQVGHFSLVNPRRKVSYSGETSHLGENV